MTSTSLSMVSSKLSVLGLQNGSKSDLTKKRFNLLSVSAADQQAKVEEESATMESDEDREEKEKTTATTTTTTFKEPRPVEPQKNVKSKNMGREYGGQWLSSTTRHVRIYAAYIDPVTCEFDQTQMDKLTLILDPTDEFLWTPESCNKVYSYFQELVDHYEGAPLTEYTLRLIGSDIEHYIRKLLFDGEIQYNMNAKVLNFSMGHPRVGFTYDGQTP